MSDLISKEKAIRLINEAIHNTKKEFFDSEWARGEMNGLGVAKDIIISGQCNAIQTAEDVCESAKGEDI